MIQAKEKELMGLVDGAETPIAYKVTPFAALHGIRLAVRLAKTFGGGLSKAANGGLNSVMDMDVSEIVEGILSGLDEDASTKLVADLLAKTERNGVFLTTDVIDKVYTQNYGELFTALKFSLEVNYGGFISALAQAANTGSQPESSAAKKP